MHGRIMQSGDDWMRMVEQRLRIMERHSHEPLVDVDPAAAVVARGASLLTGGHPRVSLSTGVSWGRFYVVGMGLSAEFPDGSIAIDMPADGTVIPIWSSSASGALVSGGRVPLSPGHALYYDLPIDGQSAGFNIVGASDSSSLPPQRWLRIVTRSIDPSQASHTWGDGTQSDAPRAASFENGWANTSTSGYVDGSYYREGNEVHLQGLISGGTPGSTSTSTAFTLPLGFRPEARIMFPTVANGSYGRVDVFSDGSVRPLSGSGTNVSLNGIAFRAVS